jgi:hypothetical protein
VPRIDKLNLSQRALDEVAAMPTPQRATLQTRSTAKRCHARLARHITEDVLRLVASELLGNSWNSNPSNATEWSQILICTEHLASIIGTLGRDSEDLQNAIIEAAIHGPLSQATMIDLLLPKESTFVVASTVIGARNLLSIEIVLPTATCINPVSYVDAVGHQTGSQWGPATPRFLDFLQAGAVENRTCVITQEVKSLDLSSAAARGRRQVLNALDQYMADHRHIELIADARSLVADPRSGKTKTHTSAGMTLSRATPLSVYWPETSLGMLHASHAMRLAEAPMTKTALAWVSFEAAGLTPSMVNHLAKALALQCLRNQIYDSHRILDLTVRETVVMHRRRLNETTHQLGVIERGLSREGLPAIRRTALELQESVQAPRVAMERDSFDRVKREVGVNWNVVQSRLESDGHFRILYPDRWFQLLLGPKALPRVATPAYMGLMEVLNADIPHLAAFQTMIWQDLLSKSHDLVDWLENRMKANHSLLESIYVARNQSLHSGAYLLDGDVLLGRGAQVLVDFTLEFLANWFRHSKRTSETPVEVIQCLSKRFDDLCFHLRGGGDTSAINMSKLTGPRTTGLDRKT